MNQRALTKERLSSLSVDGQPAALNETGDKERPSRVTPFKHAAAPPRTRRENINQLHSPHFCIGFGFFILLRGLVLYMFSSNI